MTVAPTTKQEEDKDKIIEDLTKENEGLERVVKSARDFFTEMTNSELSDKYVGKAIRTYAKKWGLKDKPKPKHKSNMDIISQTYAAIKAVTSQYRYHHQACLILK